MALWVDDEQDRFFPGPIGRNLRTSPHHRRGSRLHSLQETWSLEDNRTPCPHVRENQLVRGKKIQADHHLLDSTIRSKFSLISTTLPSHYFKHQRRPIQQLS